MTDDAILHDEKVYARAKIAARGVDISADYITRLCKGGLIDAIFANGMWYANEPSLKKYLATREKEKSEWRNVQARLRREEQAAAGFAATPPLAPGIVA